MCYNNQMNGIDIIKWQYTVPCLVIKCDKALRICCPSQSHWMDTSISAVKEQGFTAYHQGLNFSPPVSSTEVNRIYAEGQGETGFTVFAGCHSNLSLFQSPGQIFYPWNTAATGGLEKRKALKSAAEVAEVTDIEATHTDDIEILTEHARSQSPAQSHGSCGVNTDL